MGEWYLGEQSCRPNVNCLVNGRGSLPAYFPVISISSYTSWTNQSLIFTRITASKFCLDLQSYVGLSC